MLKINAISKIGIGTYRMSTNNSEDIKVIKYAIESGINIIDTASNYNFGKSELLVGQSVNKQARDSVFIISKAGYIQGEDINKVKNNSFQYLELSDNFLFSIDTDFIAFQLDNSLERLNTDYIDCYLLHNPEYYYDKNISKENLKNILFNSFSLLEEKVKEGKIRYYGISSNSLNSLPIKEILNSLHKYPNFKFLQFPYNIVERNSNFQSDSNYNITISQLKEKGLTILSNRPLNTIYENRVLRLSDYSLENIDFIENQENLLFNSFTFAIKQRLHDMQEDSSLENYYPVSFFMENRKRIANEDAIDKSINSYLIPFLEAIELKNETTLKNLRILRDYWLIFSKYDNQERLNILKSKLYDENILIKNDTTDFSLLLTENYLKSGIDTVLMGLRKKEYIDKIKNII